MIAVWEISHFPMFFYLNSGSIFHLVFLKNEINEIKNESKMANIMNVFSNYILKIKN